MAICLRCSFMGDQSGLTMIYTHSAELTRAHFIPGRRRELAVEA